jgi:hypothetical protein
VSCHKTPWQRDPAILDTQIQAFAYQAVFEAFAGADWWNGALWWELDPDEYRMGFSPADKPAFGVLIAQWRAKTTAPAL